MKFCRQSARFKTGLRKLVRLTVCVGWMAGVAHAKTMPESTWRVVVAGSLRPLGTQVQPIPGARDTKYAAAWVTADTVVFLSQEQFAKLGVDWAAFSAKTADAASAELAKIQPEFIRDRNQVIECAILRSKAPGENITAAVLAPDFLKRFAPVFGRKMLLAIPDKETVFLFPKLASRYQDYGERVLAAYGKSASPVSREVFELSTEGLRAIGEYTGP